jgi:hypothetical protein
LIDRFLLSLIDCPSLLFYHFRDFDIHRIPLVAPLALLLPLVHYCIDPLDGACGAGFSSLLVGFSVGIAITTPTTASGAAVMSIAFPSSSAFDDSLPLIANCYSLN